MNDFNNYIVRDWEVLAFKAHILIFTIPLPLSNHTKYWYGSNNLFLSINSGFLRNPVNFNFFKHYSFVETHVTTLLSNVLIWKSGCCMWLCQVGLLIIDFHTWLCTLDIVPCVPWNFKKICSCCPRFTGIICWGYNPDFL